MAEKVVGKEVKQILEQLELSEQLETTPFALKHNPLIPFIPEAPPSTACPAKPALPIRAERHLSVGREVPPTKTPTEEPPPPEPPFLKI